MPRTEMEKTDQGITVQSMGESKPRHHLALLSCWKVAEIGATTLEQERLIMKISMKVKSGNCLRQMRELMIAEYSKSNCGR